MHISDGKEAKFLREPPEERKLSEEISLRVRVT